MTPMLNDQTPATSNALFEVYQMLSDKIDEKHTNMRLAVENLGARVEARLASLQSGQQSVADRVLQIETTHKSEAGEREREQARVVRETDVRIGIFSLIVSSAVSALLWLASKLWR